MKKLLLLSALLILGCSGDDSSSYNNDNDLIGTFLDIYNGVVWRVSQTNNEGNIDSRITFLNNPNGYTAYLAQDNICVNIVFGETYGEADEEQITITIHNESENSITLKQQETGEDDFYFSYTVNSNGNSLIEQMDYGNGDVTQDTYVRETNINSCD
jgi:hypothetical protein